MSHTPIGGHPQGWDHKLADRSSLPPASGEEKSKSQSKYVFTQPHSKSGMVWREQTEGSSGSSARSPVSPPYIRWARSLPELLEDAEGVRLFRKFVGGAGGLHVERLNFYFAVQGLRQETDPAKIRQDAEGVRLFRKFVGGAGGLHVERLNFYFAVQGLRQETDPAKIRQVVSAIYKFLRKSQLAMPEELKQHVKQSLKDGSNIERTIFDNMEKEVTRAINETTYQAFLSSEAYVSYVSAATQPLSSPDASPPHPPREVAVSSGLATLHEGQELGSSAGGGFAPARLTHDALLATQSRRLHADVAPHRKRSVYSAHVTYAGYCPGSRHDSDRASLSSGRADSDAVSLSGSSVDGMSMRTREPRHHRLHGLDRHAPLNKEQDTAMMIPRTQRMQAEQLRVLPPDEFAPLLIEKLERVRRDQETKERLERRLAEGDGEEPSTQALPPQLVAAAIREKLQLDDDNDQDILDQHVSRVWSERTPGASPPGGRRARTRPHARRAPSALSADSGHYDAPSDAHHSHAASKRSFSKKTVTELTDSGVSVVSEGASVEPRILLWIAEGSERLEQLGRLERFERFERMERMERRAHRDLSSRASSADRDDHRRRDKQQQRPRGSASGGGGSKSSSTSGGGGGGSGTASTDTHTVVVVSFLDEAVPYRFKVPAAPLTLKLFKDYLPRKGNYRYFFKTNCADLDTVIQEEVCNDSDTLPVFDGKVMARVKTID